VETVALRHAVIACDVEGGEAADKIGQLAEVQVETAPEIREYDFPA